MNLINIFHEGKLPKGMLVMADGLHNSTLPVPEEVFNKLGRTENYLLFLEFSEKGVRL